MTAISKHPKTVQELCRIARRVYLPPPVPSAAELRDAVRHMVATGRATLDGFPCEPEIATELLAICRQHGWIVRGRLTAAGRRQAADDPRPRTGHPREAADA